MKRSRLAFTLLLSLATACAADMPDEIGATAQPIVGALPAGTGYPSVVSVVTFHPETIDAPAFHALCSGVLVAPHVVATAAFCLGPDVGVTSADGCTTYEAPGTLPTMAVGFGSVTGYDANDELGIGLANQLMVTGVAVAPGTHCYNNVALLALEQNVDGDYATPQTVRGELVTTADTISVVGYGPDDEYTGDYWDTKLQAEGTVSCVETDCAQPTEPWEMFYSDDAFPCLGDGGAPALDANGEVIGLAATNNNGVCDATAEFGGYVHLPRFKSWIDATVTTFSMPAGTFVPPAEPGTGGMGAGGMGAGGAPEGGAPGVGGGLGGDDASEEPLELDSDSNCTCRAAGASERSGPGWFALALGLVALTRRRAARRRAR